MKESLKELCFFMICGQTLLFFQSGRKYEKICRMILELLILAGIVGIILSFIQSLGFRKGEQEADGGAVAGMQRSMEEALSKQLGSGAGAESMFGEDAPFGESSMEQLMEGYILEEVKSKYNYMAEKYGLRIEKVERRGEKLQVYVKRGDGSQGGSAESESENGDMAESGNEGSRRSGNNSAEGGDAKSEGSGAQEESDGINAGNPAKNEKIEKIEIGKIELSGADGEERNLPPEEAEEGQAKEASAEDASLEKFRQELSEALMMESKNLEVIMID